MYPNQPISLIGNSCSMYVNTQLMKYVAAEKALKIKQNNLGRSKGIRIGSDKRKQNDASILVLLHP